MIITSHFDKYSFCTEVQKVPQLETNVERTKPQSPKMFQANPRCFLNTFQFLGSIIFLTSLCDRLCGEYDCMRQYVGGCWWMQLCVVDACWTWFRVCEVEAECVIGLVYFLFFFL